MKNYRIYKPNKTNSGAASDWQLSHKKELKFNNKMFFLTITKQTGVDDNGNSKFAWQDDKSQTVIAKLGEPDLGELLCVLNGMKAQAGTDKGIFHKNSNGSTVIQFKRMENDQGQLLSYGLQVSRKNHDDKEPVRIQHVVGLAEGEILRILLADAVNQILAT